MIVSLSEHQFQLVCKTLNGVLDRLGGLSDQLNQISLQLNQGQNSNKTIGIDYPQKDSSAPRERYG